MTTLRIEWPSDIVQELTNVAANRILTIAEPAQLVPLGPREFQIRCWKGNLRIETLWARWESARHERAH